MNLQPHQKEAIAKALKAHGDKKRGFIFNHVMGSGKTYTAVNMIMALAMVLGRSIRVLIVAPIATHRHWKHEFNTLFTRATSFTTYHGPHRKWQRRDVTLSSESTLKADLRKHKTKWTRPVFDLLIVDEPQLFSNALNHHAPKYRKVFEAIKRSFTLLLTGTPFRNRLSDISTLLWLCRVSDPENVLLYRLYSHTVLRGVIQHLLPTVKHAVVRVLGADTTLNQRCMRRYNMLAYRYVTTPTPANRKRMVCALAAARLVETAQVATRKEIVTMRGTPKMDYVLQTLRSKPNQKLIVTSNFTSVLNVMARELDVPCAVYTGENLATRDQQLDVFKNGTVNVLLLSMSAGNVGLNLFAHQMIVMDPPMNDANLDQVTKRAVRLGQTHAVTLTYLVGSAMDRRLWVTNKLKLQKSECLVPGASERIALVYGNLPEPIMKKRKSETATPSRPRKVHRH